MHGHKNYHGHCNEENSWTSWKLLDPQSLQLIERQNTLSACCADFRLKGTIPDILDDLPDLQFLILSDNPGL